VCNVAQASSLLADKHETATKQCFNRRVHREREESIIEKGEYLLLSLILFFKSMRNVENTEFTEP